MNDPIELVSFLESNWFAISSIIVLVTFAIRTTRKIQKYIDNQDVTNKRILEMHEKLREEYKKDFEEINKKVNIGNKEIFDKIEKSESKRVDGSWRTRIIMDGVEATLITLHNQGANGPVTEALERINEYKSKKAVE